MSTSGQPAPPHGSDPAARFNPLADAVNPRWLPSTERSSRRPRCRRARKGYATGGNRRRLLPVPRQSDPFSFKMCCLPDAGETRTIAVWKGSTGHEWPCGFIMHARGGTRTPTPLWDRILNPTDISSNWMQTCFRHQERGSARTRDGPRRPVFGEKVALPSRNRYLVKVRRRLRGCWRTRY